MPGRRSTVTAATTASATTAVTAATAATATTAAPAASAATAATAATAARAETPIARCVHDELDRYFTLLDGQSPTDLYRLVMQQAEASLIRKVLHECRGNQSRAASWLGISRGKLRGKLAELDDT